MLERSGFHLDRFEDWDPVGLFLVTVGDALKLGRAGDPEVVTRALMAGDRLFERIARWIPPLRHFGSILVAHARKP
jgi:hypothetical protein